MKSVKNVGIEKLENKQFDKMNSLVGGSDRAAQTYTSSTSTREKWYDKDSQKECLCEDEVR